MIRKLLYILMILSFIFSQENRDIIYLKDGSIIYGNIIDYKIEEYYKIESENNVLTYYHDEIDMLKMKMENIILEEYKVTDINDKTWSLGLGHSNQFNLFRLMKQFNFKNNFSFGLFLSPGAHLGKNGYGIELSLQEQYNKSGKFLKFSYGKYPDEYGPNDQRIDLSNIISLNMGYQFRGRINNKMIFQVGLVHIAYDDIIKHWQDFIYSIDLRNKNLTYPFASIDYKF